MISPQIRYLLRRSAAIYLQKKSHSFAAGQIQIGFPLETRSKGHTKRVYHD